LNDRREDDFVSSILYFREGRKAVLPSPPIHAAGPDGRLAVLPESPRLNRTRPVRYFRRFRAGNAPLVPAPARVA
jgi:hypothetical protein